MPGSGDQTRVGRTLTLGGGVESSLEGRDVELLVSPKDIRTSPYDLCATAWIDDNLGRGTDGSNPLPPSRESATNRGTGGDLARLAARRTPPHPIWVRDGILPRTIRIPAAQCSLFGLK